MGVHKSMYGIKCDNCGHYVHSVIQDQGFCDQCGHNITMVCKGCKALMPTSLDIYKFCPLCGAQRPMLPKERRAERLNRQLAITDLA